MAMVAEISMRLMRSENIFFDVVAAGAAGAAVGVLILTIFSDLAAARTLRLRLRTGWSAERKTYLIQIEIDAVNTASNHYRDITCAAPRQAYADTGCFMQTSLIVVSKKLSCAAAFFLLTIAFCPAIHALNIPACPIVAQTPVLPSSPKVAAEDAANHAAAPAVAPGQLIVIGFMGGDVSPGNLIHREALVAKDLQKHNPTAVYAEIFANHDGPAALHTITQLLDKNKNGCLTDAEKSSARIVIFGHSWGASEGITLARRLNELGIPVLLTVQVDSVEKMDENDGVIPPNVHEAINFYQREGLLHGRALITATNPQQTTILGNFKTSYKKTAVPIADFPWYARTFMKEHIEIENDPVIWDKIEALIQTKVL
jgi:hypothetical protein